MSVISWENRRKTKFSKASSRFNTGNRTQPPGWKPGILTTRPCESWWFTPWNLLIDCWKISSTSCTFHSLRNCHILCQLTSIRATKRKQKQKQKQKLPQQMMPFLRFILSFYHNVPSWKLFDHKQREGWIK